MFRNSHDTDELLAAARHVPEELVTTLLNSDDGPTARLGRAIRRARSIPPELPEADAGDGTRVVDPVTHDPAW
ncbi:hypothetical protein ACIQVT_12940 [Streptomyces sp. NPDC100445]|uniref:hypothetical protein n=1 Tax=Streptomyces sp. NPDC100445 TaxID=3366102 RepID=UPI0038167A68